MYENPNKILSNLRNFHEYRIKLIYLEVNNDLSYQKLFESPYKWNLVEHVYLEMRLYNGYILFCILWPIGILRPTKNKSNYSIFIRRIESNISMCHRWRSYHIISKTIKFINLKYFAK